MERRTPEGLTAPRRKSAVTGDATASVGAGRTPVISRIPRLQPSSEARSAETARPRPAGSKTREEPPDAGNEHILHSQRPDTEPVAEASDPGAPFVVEARWDAHPEPANSPTAPPAWLTQLTRWQWNSTLLAVSLAVLSAIIMTTWRRPDALPPAQLAMPTIHYHVESPYVQRTELEEADSRQVRDLHRAAMPELRESDQPATVALTAQTEPADRGSAGILPADADAAPCFELVEYPETEYPEYPNRQDGDHVDVCLDGQIQEYK